MQRKMRSLPGSQIAPIEKLFQSPRGYVEQLHSASPKAWLGALGVACAGYAIFGASIALSPHGAGGFHPIWVVPMMFILAQLVSLPALYIFHAFLGSRLKPQQVAAAGMISLLVPALLLAGMAPINWFLQASVKQPGQLLVLQQITILGIAIIGYIELCNTLPEIESSLSSQGKRPGSPAASAIASPQKPTSLSAASTRRKQLLLVWVFLYVGVLYKVMKMLTQTY